MDDGVQAMSEAPIVDLFGFEAARGSVAVERAETVLAKQSQSSARWGTFADNLKLPVHRWFRYSAGFSAEWVKNVVQEYNANRILDPFCGSGTTLIAAAGEGAYSMGIEAHPFISRIAKAKTNWRVDVGELDDLLSRILRKARELRSAEPRTRSALLLKCYDPEALVSLESLKKAYETERVESDASDRSLELAWLALTCILRECSSVGTAQWQYVLPQKTKAKVKHPYPAFGERRRMLIQDLMYASGRFRGSADVIRGDARNVDMGESEFDLVVTSPPYPNNYDYADATRLEMTFWEQVDSWGELHDAVRKHLVCSCSQHSAAERLNLSGILDDVLLETIRDQLEPVCRELEEVRLTKGGRKTYHTMVAAYFLDLSSVWQTLRRLTASGGQVAFVVGDSAPYGVYVPCDDWLGKLALAAGFKRYRFEKIRDRNIRWRNRKHRVPLKEGILWVKG